MAGSADPLVIFTPSGRRGRFVAGTRVLDAARSLGVDIDSVCGGRGICGRCQVEQGIGEFPKHGIVSAPANVTVPDAVELAYAERRGLDRGRRLACTMAVCGDALIDVPAASQVHRQVVRKELEVRPFDLDPVVRLRYVEAAPPDLADIFERRAQDPCSDPLPPELGVCCNCGDVQFIDNDPRNDHGRQALILRLGHKTARYPVIRNFIMKCMLGPWQGKG